MKELLVEYFKLRDQIHSYFGYLEDWRVIPIDDATEFYWKLLEDSVTFSDTLDFSDPYVNPIFKYKHLTQWVYRGKDYTMIVVDTQTDGNKFLQIFDNAKEIKNG